MDARPTTQPAASTEAAPGVAGERLLRERIDRVDELARRRRAGGELAEAVLGELLGELRALVAAVEPEPARGQQLSAGPDDREGVVERPARRLEGT